MLIILTILLVSMYFLLEMQYKETKYYKQTKNVYFKVLHDSGIYVFESKNYSGWIFGSETQKNCTQTLMSKVIEVILCD